MQMLDSGNVLVGYGFNAAWTEYSADGEILCDVHFGPEAGIGKGSIVSYRAFKHAWVGLPKTSPNITLEGNTTYVSWNGATEVVTWVLDGADTDDADDVEYFFLAALPKEGFETVIPVPTDTKHRFLRVLGVNASGDNLHFTFTLEWAPSEKRYGPSSRLSPSFEVDARLLALAFFIGFVSAIALAMCAYLIRYGVVVVIGRVRAAAKEKQSGQGKGKIIWGPLDVGLGGDEDLSEDEMGHDVELSLLPKPDLESKDERR